MSMQDPIGDLFTRIRNGQSAKKSIVSLPSSKLKLAIVQVLKDEGYITDFKASQHEGKPQIDIHLKYYAGKPVINKLKRVSKPGIRVYQPCKELSAVRGFGLAIVSTSQGVMTDQKAKKLKIGGEVIGEIS